MPEAVHYTWSQMAADTPMEKIARRRIIGRQAMLSEVRLGKGFIVPTHSHENEQFACVISGKLRFGIGAEGTPQWREVDVAGGGVMYLPANVPHSATALEDSVVLDVFSPPSEKTGVDRR
jgi:quercetin dioxygenase-like cupin family protein